MKKNKQIFFILILITSLLLFSACSQQSQMESKTSSIYQKGEVKNCKITKPQTDIKASTDNNSAEIAILNKNDIVKVLSETSRWYIVQTENNRIGFLDKNNAKAVVKDGQEPQHPQPTQYPEREEAPQKEVEASQDLSTMERDMINMVNSARRENGLKPYIVDGELTNVARIKAKDMVENNYFSHYSPTYGSPFEMMDHFGIEYLRAGENLAGNQSAQAAHSSLMNSSGHRKNILNDKFTHIGIGVKESDKYGYVFVQLFISKPE